MHLTQIQAPKVAISGINLVAGSCNLDAFERLVYEGKQNFSDLPAQRWQAIENLSQYELAEPPQGAYLAQFDIDLQRFNLIPEELEKANPHELLILKVIDEALKDANIAQGEKVAVIITTATQISLQKLQKKQPPSLQREYPERIQNNVAQTISRLWQFTAPAFTLTAEENSAFKALEVAQNLLLIGEADAVVVGAVDLAGSSESVLVRHQAAPLNTGTQTLSYDKNANGWNVGEGAGAVVLKLHNAVQERDRIYAVIDAISLLPQSVLSNDSATSVTQVCQRAFQIADIHPQDIDYLELHASGISSEDSAEISGLLAAYQTTPELSCAIGSAKANIGHTYAAAEIISLIKTALCLYYRYIPATPQWTSPKNAQIWQNSPFYVATESKPWFSEQARQRVAAINTISLDGSYAHIILSESNRDRALLQTDNRYLAQMPFYLLAIAADNSADLVARLENLQQQITDCSDLATVAKQAYIQYKTATDATYALAIVGRNKNDLFREIQRAIPGVERALAQGEDWQTPAGSYFTAKPLGKKGAIAYVYPGAFNSYIGISRNLFRLFPHIYDDVVIKSACNRVAKIEKILYPRSLPKLSKRQLEHLEQKLLDDPLAMLESEMGYAGLMTTILNNYFQVKPQSTFGYSLGETSMMFSQGVWTDFQKCSDALNSSSLFTTRLAGAKDAVREYWNLSTKEAIAWSTYILIAPATQVQEYIQQETQVYLTQINTSQEVVIAGDTQACLRLIDQLKCDAIPAPFNHVIHCDAMRSEYAELVKIKTLPVQNLPGTSFYSSAEYAPFALNSASIAHHIAKCLCQQVDFPKLVNRVYADGAKIFLEVGAGSNCSRWIGDILKHQKHVTVAVNRRGVDDHASILKALAKLVSHRVSLDLSPLYSDDSKHLSPNTSPTTTITLGEYKPTPSPQIYKQPVVKINENTMTAIAINSNTSTLIDVEQHISQPINHLQSLAPVKSILAPSTSALTLNNPSFAQFTRNNNRITQTHQNFLQARQQALHQMSQLIQLQMACSQHLNTQKPAQTATISKNDQLVLR